MSAKLTALSQGETWPLNASERARYMVLAARSDYRGAVRGKSPDRLHRKLDAILDEARTRIKAEEAAEKALKDQKIREKAEAKAKRRSENKWW